MGISYHSETGVFHLFTDHTSYQILLYENCYPLHLYWGPRVYGDAPSSRLEASYQRRQLLLGVAPDDPMFSREYLPFEYPCYGTSDFRSPAYELTDSQGRRITDARYEGHEILPGKPPIAGLPCSHAESGDAVQTLVITLFDRLLQLRIRLFYTVFEAFDLICRHTEFENCSGAPITLDRALSFSMDFKHGPGQLLQLSGTALRETYPERRALGTGMTGFESRRGFSSHQHNPFAALVNSDTTETSGEAFAVSLVYSGHFILQAEKDMHGSVRFQGGINPFGFGWRLNPGEPFSTPEALLCCSESGLETLSLRFHRFFRERLSRGIWRSRPRPILLNTWEASYFSFTHESILELARAAADVGTELLVLDDGWFGHRDNSLSSLGDWTPDLRKLPRGIKGLCADINALGLDMGLWFEPEMVSPDSKLYRAHPDWCLHVPDRKRTQWRHQLVLDLSRVDVRDYIVKSVSDILGSCNLRYVKWDCNRRLTEVGSALDTPSGELFHRYILGLSEVLERITSAFPEVLFENCASGGGRFDPGMMCYFSQNWASDNTDAVSRLKIQYGASLVYPPVWISSHISASPNHQLARATPMEFREHVCQPFNLGSELNLLQLSEAELAEVRAQILRYREIREIVQFGEFRRLRSPFDGTDTAWMVTSADGRDVLCWYYKPRAAAEEAYLGFRLRGLDETASYRLVGTDEICTGSILMHMGLTIDWKNGDHFSQFWHFRRMDS